MSFAALVSIAAATSTQTGTETFSATAAIKTAGGAQATAPVTITVTHKMSQAEADKYTSAFASGGVAALRKALTGVAPTGSIQIGAGKATPTRLTLERPSDRGRMLTIVTDQPLMFVGAGMPNAKPKEGFDFGIVDIIVTDKGRHRHDVAGRESDREAGRLRRRRVFGRAGTADRRQEGEVSARSRTWS